MSEHTMLMLGSIGGVLFVLTILVIMMHTINSKVAGAKFAGEGFDTNGDVDPRYYRDFIQDWRYKYATRNQFKDSLQARGELPCGF